MIFILPLIKCILQSAKSAKYLLWVAKIIILFLFFNFKSNLNISLDVFISRLPVGSSARIISGELIKALEIATRYISPPDNSVG